MSRENFYDKDVAIEIMADLIAMKDREIIEEREKGNSQRAIELEAEMKQLLEERKRMYFGDQEIIDKILNVYAEKVRKHYLEEYKLPAEVHNQIFERIKNRAWEGTTSVEKPKIVILGGQPGAGKSKLIEASKSLFPDGNVVIINGDEYRKEHPKSKEIFAKHERDYARLTDPDVRVWTKKLFDLSMKRKEILFLKER